MSQQKTQAVITQAEMRRAPRPGEPLSGASWRRRFQIVKEVAETVPPRLRWGYTAGNLVALASSALLPVSLKWIVDGVTTGNGSRAVAGVVLACVGAAGADGGGRSQKDLMVYFQYAGGHQITVRIMRTIARLPSLEQYERPEHQDQMQVISGQGMATAAALTQGVSSIRTMAGLAISIVLLATVDPLLVLFPMFVLPSIWLIPRVHRLRIKAQEEAAEHQRAALALHSIFPDPDAAMEMRVFGAAAGLDEESDRRWQEAVSTRIRGESRAALVSSLGLAVLAAGYVAALAVVAWRSRGQVTAAGSAVMVIHLAQGLRHQLESAVSLGQTLRGATDTLDRLAWLDDYRATGFEEVPDPRPVPQKLTSGIRLRDVTFRYPGTDSDALEDVNLDLPAGSVVALVGDNGAGKTTLVKLLCGFYRPTRGSMEVDGTDLTLIPAAEWQATISGAFQDYLRLEDEFRGSVAPSRPGAIVDDDRVRHSAERGDALAMTRSWEEGLSTHLGKSYREGVQLSGGQWQRVAVARAMHPTAPLLIVLDEPTAALDPAAEHRLYLHYSRAAREARERNGCITVLISHRFSTVRMADRIVVVDGGRVAEQGSHDELMAAGGRYAHLFRQQAAAYG